MICVLVTPVYATMMQKKKKIIGVSVVAQWVKNLTSIPADSIPGLTPWIKDPVLP